jgi:hypothetical protein
MDRYVSRNAPRVYFTRLKRWPDTSRRHDVELLDALKRRREPMSRASAAKACDERAKSRVELARCASPELGAAQLVSDRPRKLF